MNWKLSKRNSSGQFQEIIPAVTGMNGEEYEGRDERKKSVNHKEKIKKEKANWKNELKKVRDRENKYIQSK